MIHTRFALNFEVYDSKQHTDKSCIANSNIEDEILYLSNEINDSSKNILNQLDLVRKDATRDYQQKVKDARKREEKARKVILSKIGFVPVNHKKAWKPGLNAKNVLVGLTEISKFSLHRCFC